MVLWPWCPVWPPKGFVIGQSGGKNKSTQGKASRGGNFPVRRGVVGAHTKYNQNPAGRSTQSNRNHESSVTQGTKANVLLYINKS